MSMKSGDLVTLDPEIYVREKGYVGQLLERAPTHFGERWIVLIKGRVHPYYVDGSDMEVIGESR
jgi:hypothetical protein